MTNTDEIIVFVGNEKIELTGKAKESFIAQRQADLQEEESLQAVKEATAIAKSSLLQKLGISEDEARLLLA